MKDAKCTSCGAAIKVDENKELGVCEYCGNAYITEKAIANVENNVVNNAQVVNNYYGTPVPQVQEKVVRQIVQVPPRPKANAIWVVLGLLFYIIPGLFYLAYISGKQKEWDEKYGK